MWLKDVDFSRIDRKHADFIRSLPCASCGQSAERCEHAHVKMLYCGDVTVPETERGYTGIKPHDKWSVPLCRGCHTLQHNRGERWFWQDYLHMNPLELATALYRNTGNRVACLGILMRAREGQPL